MVEQRPFKALVVGSSPTQPTLSNHSVGLINTRNLANYSFKALCERTCSKTPKNALNTASIWQVTFVEFWLAPQIRQVFDKCLLAGLGFSAPIPKLCFQNRPDEIL